MLFRSIGWRGLVAAAVLICGEVWFLSSQDSVAAHADKEKPLAISDLYMHSCIRCHAKDGKGKEAREVTPRIPDFTSHKWHKERSDAQLLVSIQEGKGKEMPAFAEKINREEAQQLVAYIRRFDAEQARPQSSPRDEQRSRVRGTAQESRSDFDMRLQELLTELEGLRKQFHALESRPSKPDTRLNSHP